MLIGLAVCAAGIRWFLSCKKTDPRVIALADAQVVWLYLETLRSNRSGFSASVCLGTDTGKRVKIWVARTTSPHEAEQEKVRKAAADLLQQIAPHYPRAALGFNSENQAAFKKAQSGAKPKDGW